MKGKVYIVAGGTGGHINGALSIGESFLLSDFEVHYISGKRFLDFKLFLKENNVIHLNAWPLRYKNPFRQFMSVFFNTVAFLKCFFMFLITRPNAAIGCGGYVCGPVLLGAKLAGIPVFILEQNAAAGVTNKILANISDINFVQFENTKGLEKFKTNTIVTGNPIRNIEISKEKASVFTLLVFGGSLGAQQINESLELIINGLSDQKIKIIHQGGKESKPIQVDNENIDYEHFEYIDNIYEHYKTANLIVSRAGASSVSELTMLNTNCILIPYPQATDNHQYYNAKEMEAVAKCEVKILDSNKDISELSEDLLIAIKELRDKESPRDLILNNSAENIKKEVIKYVFGE